MLVDTIPLLCKGKDDVLLFLRRAGASPADLAEMTARLRADRNSVIKFAIVRDVLDKLNSRGDSALAARREVIKHVAEFEESRCAGESPSHRGAAMPRYGKGARRSELQ